MPPPAHHKEVARYLRDVMPGETQVIVYGDNADKCPIPIGRFAAPKSPFYSTIGAFDTPKGIPAGDYEFAACGTQEWLPNAIASSVYWLKGRQIEEWPLVCEDAVRHNTRSPYRHMAYIPSPFKLALSTGQLVQWLLGVPIEDKEICLTFDDVTENVMRQYPEWLLHENA